MNETATRARGPRSKNGYVVLREHEGLWTVVETRPEKGIERALAAAVAAHPPEDDEEPGRWVAVPVDHWKPRPLKPRTVYDFEDAA